MKQLTARPTTYKGVDMRSRLEAGFAQWLDGMRWTWAYEPECFASENGQWLPDFRVDIPCVSADVGSGQTVYIEVKPATFTLHDLADLRPRILGLYASKPNDDVAAVLAQEGHNPLIITPDGDEPLDWTWTGLWPIDARRVEGPWQGEWWKGVAA